MAAFKLKDDIYYIGSFNPNLRIFDIIMSTEFGTTYNAYLIKGERTALIETVHNRFADEFMDNINSISAVENIDYVVLNHTEPDHSGCLIELIKIKPDIKVVGTAAAIKNLASITNTEFNGIVAKDGDSIDLGNGKVLRFIIAPNLHWPDSMFTYLEADKLVFTCDFLGSHYCETGILDTRIKYPEYYERAFKHYYEAIFSPFKKFVLAGLEKLEKLDFDMVCPSHGPVLTHYARTNMEKYKVWSSSILDKGTKKKVAIFYVSAYGYTEEMAMALKDGLESSGVLVRAYDIINYDLHYLKERLEQADGVLFGSPTINRDAVKPVWDLLSVTDAVINAGKPCNVFGSYGWSGEACAQLYDRIKGLKLKPIGEPFKVMFKPTDKDLDSLRAYAAEFAKVL